LCVGDCGPWLSGTPKNKGSFDLGSTVELMNAVLHEWGQYQRPIPYLKQRQAS
jgi:hypothetical protein